MTLSFFIVYGAGLYLLARMMRDSVLRFLRNHEVTEYNYHHVRIPSASGILIWLVCLSGMLLLATFQAISLALPLPVRMPAYWLRLHELNVWLFAALTIVCGLGWTDDLIGKRTIKGLRGHLAAWRYDREITTGLLKAVGTWIAALWLTVQTGLWNSSILGGFTAALLMSLSTNTLNLLDLRPGRALKIFLTCGLLAVGCATTVREAAWLLVPAFSGGLALLPLDLRGRSMLGDTGANALGFVLGATMAFTWAWHLQAVALVILAGIHILAEKYSLSQLIERVPVLRWLDGLGRNQP